MTHHVKFFQIGDPLDGDVDRAPSMRWLAFIREAEPMVDGRVGGTDEANPPYAVFTPAAGREPQLRELARKHEGRMRKGEPRGIRLGWA